MSRLRDPSYRWAFYATAGLLFAGTVLRSSLVIDEGDVLVRASVLLAAWLALFLSQVFFVRFWRPWLSFSLAMQAVIALLLLLLPGTNDFFAMLFGIMTMQAVFGYGLWVGAVCVALFVPLTLLPLLRGFEASQAATLALTYLAVNLFLGAYALTTQRATEARAANQTLVEELRRSNAQLAGFSKRLEARAVAEERNRLARELHDSVTQTIFSMTLASQSAGILIEREPAKVDAQLERIGQLAQGALAEMRVLISELAPDGLPEGSLPAAIRRDIDRRALDGLQVEFELEEPEQAVAGQEVLSIVEQQGLLRIAQEALNNVVKHSGVTEATIRLDLRAPFRLEIEDRGRGFDVEPAKSGSGVGLASMNERAADIGWDLAIVSSAGEGTIVKVTRPDRREERDDN